LATGSAAESGLTAWLRARLLPHDEPGAAIFRVLRLRLALGFAGLLAAALLLVGSVLYVSLDNRLLLPFHAILDSQIQFQTGLAMRTGRFDCPPRPNRNPGPPRPANPFPVSVACYEADGTLGLATFQPPDEPGEPDPDFLSPELFHRVVASHHAEEDRLTLADGSVLLRIASPVFTPNGQLGGVVQVAHEITTQRETMALVGTLMTGLSGLALLVSLSGGWLLARRALTPARLAFNRQQSFIADASHELRTPMALLRANAEVLLRSRDRFQPEDAELMEDIVAETEHMSRLTTDLLTLARLDANALELEREVVDLAALAEGLARRVTPTASSRGVQVKVATSGPVLTLADADAIDQAGLILVENAVKYTPSGGSVTVRAETNGKQARLVVADTGQGIPHEHLSRLGQRFYRVDKSRARETGGTGLGLAIAFRIASAHGGAVQLASEVGVGTTAELVLKGLEPA
jgi:signal transduction histidine kinase